MRHLSDDELAWLAMDAMEPAELEQAKTHLRACSRCQAGLRAERALEMRLHAAYTAPKDRVPAEPRPANGRLSTLVMGLVLAAGALLSLDTRTTTPSVVQTDPTLGLDLQPPDAQHGRYLTLPQDICRDCGKP